jgi:hypothetical protein
MGRSGGLYRARCTLTADAAQVVGSLMDLLMELAERTKVGPCHIVFCSRMRTRTRTRHIRLPVSRAQGGRWQLHSWHAAEPADEFAKARQEIAL